MSLDIDQIALHQMIKLDEQTLELVLRESPLEVSPAVQDMMVELCTTSIAPKAKLMAFLHRKANWRTRYAAAAGGMMTFSASAAPRRSDCAMSWRNTLLPKGGEDRTVLPVSSVALKNNLVDGYYTICHDKNKKYLPQTAETGFYFQTRQRIITPLANEFSASSMAEGTGWYG